MRYLLLTVLAAFLPVVSAHTVTLNLVMNIGNNANNTIHANSTDYNATTGSLTFINMDKKYISANNTTTIAAVVSAGTLLNVRMDTKYNSTHYLLQMTQDSEKNRFLIAMTNGTYNDVDDRLNMIDNIRMVSSTFGKFIVQVPAAFTTFIRLEYTNVDITGVAEWSGIGQLSIGNRGMTSRNLPNITLGVTR